MSRALWTFFRNLTIASDRALKCSSSFVTFCGGNPALTILPQQLDRFATPHGASSRRTNRLTTNDYVDRVGMQLWEMTYGHPTAAIDRDLKRQVVD